MSEIQERFEKAQVEVNTLPDKPGTADLLTLYSLFKQATEGDAADAEKPGAFDFVAKSKYDAWSKMDGKSAEDAKAEYVATVDRLLGR